MILENNNKFQQRKLHDFTECKHFFQKYCSARNSGIELLKIVGKCDMFIKYSKTKQPRVMFRNTTQKTRSE